MNISLLDFLLALIASSIIIFGLILAIVLFLKKSGNRTSFILLGLLVLVASLVLIDDLILLIGLPGQFNQLYYLPLDFGLMMGPLQFFYFKSKLRPAYRFKGNDVIHFLIPSVQIAVLLYVGFSSVSFKYSVWQNGFMDTFLLVVSILFPILCSLYGFKSFLLLRKDIIGKKGWKNQLHTWLTRFLYVLGVLILVQTLFLIVKPLVISAQEVLSYLQFTLLLLLLLWFSIKAWQQYFPQLIYVGPNLNKTNTLQYIAGTEEDIFKKKTEALFGQQQIFTNPDLNLDILKKEYGLSRRKISEMIKTIYGKSFVEFVNGYRVNYVMTALKNGEHKSLTLLAIAFDAGFSSKSTFYRTFKQKTNLTPSEYLSNF